MVPSWRKGTHYEGNTHLCQYVRHWAICSKSCVVPMVWSRYCRVETNSILMHVCIVISDSLQPH